MEAALISWGPIWEVVLQLLICRPWLVLCDPRECNIRAHARARAPQEQQKEESHLSSAPLLNT